MRLLLAFVFVVLLVALVAQLHANPAGPETVVTSDADGVPLVVGADWPWWEPVSVVFILGGAAAMGLWRLARKLRLV